MQDFDFARLTYLMILGSVLLVWFVAQNRASLGKLAQQALIWGLIFVGALAAVGLWEDIRQTVRPMQSVVAGDRIEVPRAPDGHYYLTVEIEGVPVRFVVDTGASQIVLSQSDAERIGLDTKSLAYLGRAYTANGEVRTAPVRLESLAVGPVRHENLRAVVNQGEMGQSLLGMEYLQRFSSIEITGGRLVLTR
ncbi:putative Gag-polyprotein aspartyl protease [Roseovarius sp. EC-HK134]|uniref:TIGR02281 family clan AA aspartic protease n=1 Tax=Roseovarius TaxID=74030 RepID=UPI00125146D5|nr:MULTISPECIES: TIGR02281 family clan AA aspartic protease [Roseovarius]MBW4975887.1 TIGR02281 family clan AA aspartic protease [Roseovarius mucosus]VVT23458.1 putative Gag-polyprotein aspartyl protease [Roseovarius sp. EC-SD190]VVT23636.1 putative Gag-polyprotein aspartyl protease [Roseovarius sp. EC-HK134]|tara:strand:+ start:198 stop:776 length:579 start_codon:yes stop_codon:yes gene_type:complete